MTYIDFPAYCLGVSQQSLETTANQQKLLSPLDAMTDAGFAQHYISAPEQTAYDLAKGAMEDMLNSYPEVAKLLPEVDLIIYVTCLPCNGNLGSEKAFQQSRDVKHLMDFPVSRLQSDFGMDNAFVMGMNQQACTGMLSCMRVANAMLASEPQLNNILCITADRFPQGAIYEQAYNLISDGGACCMVRRDQGRYRYLQAHHITNGAMATANDEETAGFYFSYSHRLINELCNQAKIPLSEVNWIIPQNTNRKAWRILSSVLSFDYERILMTTIEEVGHCISGDNIINLKTAQNNQHFSVGDKLLLPMAGFGLNWSAVLLEVQTA